MRLSAFDQFVLLSVMRIRTSRIATIERIRADLISQGCAIEPTLQRIHRSIENLETAGYLESALMKANGNGDRRMYADTVAARTIVQGE